MFEKSVLLFEKELPSFWLYGVPFTPVICLQVGASGDVSAGLETSIAVSQNTRTGVIYSDNKWTPIGSINTSHEFKPIDHAEVGLTVKAYAGPNVSFLVCGLAGPGLGITPFLELDTKVQTSEDPWWELFLGCDANVVINMKKFGDKNPLNGKIEEYHKVNVLGGKKLIADVLALPNSPTDFKATCNSQDKIILSWKDQSAIESGFILERGTSEGGPYSFKKEISASDGIGKTITYEDVGLSPGTTYYYRLSAKNEDGISPYQYVFWTTHAQPVPPAAPTGLIASSLDSNKIQLNWSDQSGIEEGFRIKRKIGIDGIYEQIHDTQQSNTNAFLDTTVTGDTQYFYRVYAYNNVGGSSYSNEISVLTMNQPKDLTVSIENSSFILLEWTNNSHYETSYKIDRKIGVETWVPLATIVVDRDYDDTFNNKITFGNSGLSSGVTYHYRIRAANDSGYSSYSDDVKITLPYIINAPSNLVATPVSSSVMELNWQDNSDNEDGFKVDRKEGDDGVYELVATVGVNEVFVSDSGLSSDTTYYYRVRAYSTSEGFSDYSNEVSATTLSEFVVSSDNSLIDGGYGHSLGLKSDGTVWAWGRNYEGQLGDGTNYRKNIPVQVEGLLLN
ncbi:MAG: fibronectin type III domain-containing protein [Halanaerobiales bacterium]|nr:fibronectin type III domain-containing protein [Halanaerobiales bacterium]